MATLRGFEPLTYPLGGDCSIQLSYRAFTLRYLGVTGGDSSTAETSWLTLVRIAQQAALNFSDKTVPVADILPAHIVKFCPQLDR